LGDTIERYFSACVEYCGSIYHGWQKQPGFTTVQSTVEDSFSKVADEKINTVCSGRTDAGVHALNQIISFTTTSSRSADNFVRGVNTHLPKDVRIIWVEEVPQDFHARFSAVSRKYVYVIDNSQVHSALFYRFSSHYSTPIDENKIIIASKHLIGEHNFHSFRSSECQAKNPIRVIKSIDIKRKNNFIFITIEANAFLHSMVRIIVGSFLEVGWGRKDSAWIKNVLEKKDRREAGNTAKPNGLYLQNVKYDNKFCLPKINSNLWIFDYD
jgi:tRNA pseudouridine38-40 synthase